MNSFFKLKEHNTTVGTEAIAGVTTFFTMVYIIFVNPSILSQTGMSWTAVFVATILATIIGTLVMGLFANVPYALAPGMGLNAFFTFTVCFAMSFTWQEALAMVFICGVINIVITVTKVRKIIIKSIPHSLQSAIGGGIGIFIAYIGIKGMGLLQFTSSPGDYQDLGGTIVANSGIVPEMVLLNSAPVILALIGLLLTIILLVLKIKGAIFIGILATTLIGFPMGVVTIPDGFKLFDVGAIGDLKLTFGAAFTDGFPKLFSETDPSKYLLALVTIFAFSLSDTFDTIGTFIGTGRVSGIFDEKDEKALAEGKGFTSKMDKALFADASATSIGAILGTSNTTTYVESSAGIAAGGRTGLTSVFVAILFALCLPFSNLFGLVPGVATGPALVVVGIMMMQSFSDIKWKELNEAIPAFMAGVLMAFVYNISYGIAFAFIFYSLVKIATGKPKEVHPIVYGASVLFILNFIFLAIA